MKFAKPGCYFLREIAKGRPYTLGGESDGQSLLCVFHDTGERAWARICDSGRRHGAKVGAQECSKLIRQIGDA